MIKVKRASEFKDSSEMVQRAHELFYDVYFNLPRKPVSILPRKKEHFIPEQVLIAFKEEILGITLLEPAPTFNNNELIFKSNALDIISKHNPEISHQELFMISSMAIKPEARGQGVGSALYEKAKQLSNLNCIGILYKNNIPGRNLARKAGFIEIPTPTFKSNYSFSNGYHILDENGSETLEWNLFTSIPRLK